MRSRHAGLANAGVGVFGVSVDSVFSHQAFADQLGGLPYPLVADFERKAVTAYGVRRDDVDGYRGMPARSIFVIDRHGVIRWTWARTAEQPMPDYDEVVRAAEGIAGRE